MGPRRQTHGQQRRSASGDPGLDGRPVGLLGALATLGVTMLALAAVVLLGAPAEAQFEPCPDGFADPHVGTFRQDLPPAEQNIPAPYDLTGMTSLELVVDPDGSATVSITGELSGTVADQPMAVSAQGVGTGTADPAAGLLVQGETSSTTTVAGMTDSMVVTWTVTGQLEGNRWVAELAGGGESQPLTLQLVSRPGAADPQDPCGPVAGSPLLDGAESADRPAVDETEAPVEPDPPEGVEDPEGRPDAEAEGVEEPQRTEPGAPTGERPPIDAQPGGTIAGGALEDVGAEAVGAAAADSVLGMEPLTASAVGAAVAAGLIGLGQLLLSGAQAGAGSVLSVPGAGGALVGAVPSSPPPPGVPEAPPHGAPAAGVEAPSSWVEAASPDGSSTRRETYADGRVLQTRVAADGHRVVTQWWPDGRVERVEDTRAAAAAAAAEVGPAVPGAVGDELLGTPSEQQATVPASAPAPDDGTLEQPAPDAGPGSDQETVLDTDPDEEPESEVASEEEPEEEPASEVEPEEEPAPPTDRELMLMDVEFNRRLRELVAQLRADGYYVMNRNAAASAYNRLLGQYVVDPFTGHTGGTCGDFVDWGEQWLEPLVREVYGDHAVLSQISVESSSMRNHTANRIVTRNADNVVDLHYILSSEHRDGWTVDAELWFERNARAYRSLGGRPAEVAIDPSTGTMDGLSSLESSLERLLTSPRGEQLLTEQGLDGILDGWVDRASGSERTQRQVVADAFRRRGSMQHLYARALGPRLSAP